MIGVVRSFSRSVGRNIRENCRERKLIYRLVTVNLRKKTFTFLLFVDVLPLPAGQFGLDVIKSKHFSDLWMLDDVAIWCVCFTWIVMCWSDLNLIFFGFILFRIITMKELILIWVSLIFLQILQKLLLFK